MVIDCSLQRRRKRGDVDGALELVITLPGQRPFQALGVIRHVTARAPEEYFGLEFTRISERALEGIEAYVTARLRVPRSAG